MPGRNGTYGGLLKKVRRGSDRAALFPSTARCGFFRVSALQVRLLCQGRSGFREASRNVSGQLKSSMRRVVRRPASRDVGRRFEFSLRPADWFRTVIDYVGLGRSRRRSEPLTNPAALARFLQARASFVAQTSLYGYLRTRAGMRYPELFDDDPFVEGINIAKWHIWLACLSDLAVHAGCVLQRTSGAPIAQISELMQRLVAGILEETGVPQEAGAEFPAHVQRVRERLATCDWAAAAIDDDERVFTESPDALVHWAPVIDELKQLDEHIVRNSIRFRWQETRRELRQTLDVDAVLGQEAVGL